MSGIVDVRVNLADVERGLAAIRARGDDLSRVFRAAKTPAKKDQAAHAAAAMGPNGPWPVRSSATMDRVGARASKYTTTSTKRKSARGAGAKIKTTRRATNPLGILPRSVSFRAERDQLTATSEVVWSDAHQKGGAVGRGSVLPAREFLWWSEPFIASVANAIEIHVIAPWDAQTRAAAAGLDMTVSSGRVRL